MTGTETILSSHTVDKTVDRLLSALAARGVKLFVLVDHSGEAAAAGFTMPPTRLLIFGNPKAGTPLMLAAPAIALDLPLKILIAEDTAGKVWITWNTPESMMQRYALPVELAANLALLPILARAIA